MYNLLNAKRRRFLQIAGIGTDGPSYAKQFSGKYARRIIPLF
jgi:hypothetical protein